MSGLMILCALALTALSCLNFAFNNTLGAMTLGIIGNLWMVGALIVQRLDQR